MITTKRYFRENTEDYKQSDALLDGGANSSHFYNNATASSKPKGKGKAREDVTSNEKVTLPSLEHFPFEFVIFDPVAKRSFMASESEPGPSAERRAKKAPP